MTGSAPDICIYHANCDDGFAAAYAVWKKFGDTVTFIPAQHGGDIPAVAGKDVLIVDFSFKKPVMEQLAAEARRIIVLDHHKTAEAELAGFTRRMECAGGPFEKRYADKMRSGVGVCLDMDKSGCRLAWEYCFGDAEMPSWFAAIEDRDLWRFLRPYTKDICIAIRSYPRDFRVWDRFNFHSLATDGEAIRRYVDMIVSNICDTAFVENIGGHDVPVAACSYDFVSEVANQLLERNPDAPFAACIVRSYDGVTYSLRSTNDRMDVSEIAKAHGGGGHRNAAGFRVKTEPPSTHVVGDRFEIRDSHFGPYIAPSLPQGCDMIVVFANKFAHTPVWMGMPHQFYLREARRLIAEHGGDHLTIVPYRNADKIDIPQTALATTEAIDHG